MTMRSIELFAHIVGVLALFVTLAVEWLSLELVRTCEGPALPPVAVNALRALPRLTGIAVGLILLSGVPLAARVGVLGFAWIRVSFGAMVLMGIAGGISLRPVLRTLNQQTERHTTGASEALRRHAADPVRRAALRMRIVVGLAIVYLMIAKPEVMVSTLAIALALVLALAASVLHRESPVRVVRVENEGKASTLAPE